MSVGVYRKNAIFCVYILLFMFSLFLYYFFHSHIFPCEFPCLFLYISLRLTSFFLSTVFLRSLFLPSSFKILFYAFSLFSVPILLQFFYFFLPFFLSFEMPFSVSCVSTLFTGSRPERCGTNDSEDMFSCVGLKHPQGLKSEGFERRGQLLLCLVTDCSY